MLNIPSYQENSNQITLRLHLTPVRMAKIKNSGVGIVGGIVNWYNHSGNQSSGSLEYWT